MSDAVKNVLEHNGIEVGPDELAHYGVRGMKWGKRKQARVAAREVRGKELLDKNEGSAGKALSRQFMKQYAINVISHAGATAIGQLSKNPVVAAGARSAAEAIQLRGDLKLINQAVDIHAYKNRDK